MDVKNTELTAEFLENFSRILKVIAVICFVLICFISMSRLGVGALLAFLPSFILWVVAHLLNAQAMTLRNQLALFDQLQKLKEGPK